MTARQPVAEALAAAFAHMDGGRTEEARRLARQLGKQSPDLPGLPYLEGLIALADREGAKAARHLARALKATPDAPPLLLAMARAQAMQGRDAEAEDHYRRLMIAAPKSAAGRAELAALLIKRGINHRNRDELGMAAALFGEAASFDSGSVLAHALLAQTREQLGARDDAVAAYRRALELDPADGHGAALALARLGAAAAPASAPAAFVAGLFDQYAEGFETDLVGKLHYRGPALLLDAVRRSIGAGPFEVFDAGCGTGLMGATIGPWARRLDGADLSPRMVEQASRRAVYHSLAVGDLVALLGARPAAYDLVTAADVLVYMGDLAPLFAAVAAALKPGGAFAFTVETSMSRDWQLNDSGRYAHGADYLWRLAAAHGFAVALLEEAWARHDRGAPAPGMVAVMRKDA